MSSAVMDPNQSTQFACFITVQAESATKQNKRSSRTLKISTKKIMKKIYQSIASKIGAIENCIKSNNEIWQHNHTEAIQRIIKETAPSGSGIDCGTKIEMDDCTAEKLVFVCSFHHMNENGYYDGWTSHRIIVTPSLAHGFSLKITGKDRNQIKEYLADVYHNWLDTEIQENY